MAELDRHRNEADVLDHIDRTRSELNELRAAVVSLLCVAGQLEGAVRLSGWVDPRIAAEPEEYHPLELAAYHQSRGAAASACTPERLAALQADGAAWSDETAIEAMIAMLRAVVTGESLL
ncbi:MAG: hypothetical protein HZB16_10120 [Armatimonadetes bacterium]|nr:hypothetical protein [Armatimonadota bacterium]